MFALLFAVAPVCEEILFRGLGQEWLAAIIGFWPALAIAAASCTIGHVKALGFGRQLIPVAVLSVILGVEVGVLGTLIPAMVTHAVCNLVGMRDTLIYVKGNPCGLQRRWEAVDSVASYIFVIVLLMACVEAVTILSLVKSRRDDSVSKEVAGLREDIKALLREIRELKEEIRELRRELTEP